MLRNITRIDNMCIIFKFFGSSRYFGADDVVHGHLVCAHKYLMYTCSNVIIVVFCIIYFIITS